MERLPRGHASHCVHWTHRLGPPLGRSTSQGAGAGRQAPCARLLVASTELRDASLHVGTCGVCLLLHHLLNLLRLAHHPQAQDGGALSSCSSKCRERWGAWASS